MALSCLPEQKQEREQQQMTEVERLQVDKRRVCAGVMVEVNMVAAGLKHPKSSGVDEKEKTSIALPGSTVMVVAEDAKGGGKLDEEEGSLSGLQDKWTLDGSVDFRGRPAIKAKTGRWSAGFLVLVNQGLATLAFFGVGVNLVLFLTRVLHQDNADAANNVSKWTGTVYLFSLVGAFMSDSYWGRYKTCVVFQSIFVVGLLMLSGCSYLFLINPKGCGGSDESSVLCENHTPWQVAMFNLSVYLVALGNGGYQPNIATFGADQFDGDDPKEAHSKVAFFSYFYLALNLGSLFSNTVLTYVEDEGLWVLGFGVSALSAFLALVLFLVGTPWYRHFRPAGNPLTRVCQVVVAASRKYWVVKVGIPSADELYEEQGRRSTGGSSNSSCKHAMDDDDVASVNGSAGRKLLHTHGFRFLDRAAVPVGQYDLVGFNNDDPDLQHDNKTKYAAASVVVVDPWRLCTVTQVEEVKCVLRLLPIWLCTILYSVVFTQMASLFVEQGASMRLDIGAFRIPPASMSAFDILSVAFFIFFYRRVIDPLVCRLNRHLGGGNNKASSAGMTELQRMGVGLVIAIAAMMAAGTVEHYRLKHRDGQGTGSSLSILWQIPQYALVGASEVFMYVGQLEFFNRETPDGLKSFGSALCMTSISLGNYVSSVIVTIVMKVTATASRGWIPDNLNQGHLDDFYFLLAILTALDLGVYLLCANWYKPSNRQPLVQSDNNSITTTTITSATASPSSSESSRSYP